jgi:hypothetical protein
MHYMQLAHTLSCKPLTQAASHLVLVIAVVVLLLLQLLLLRSTIWPC